MLVSSSCNITSTLKWRADTLKMESNCTLKADLIHCARDQSFFMSTYTSLPSRYHFNFIVRHFPWLGFVPKVS
jgi:hypothetical protein